MKGLFHFSLGRLRRRRARNFALFVSTAAVSATLLSALFFEAGVEKVWRSALAATSDLTVQRQVGGRPALLTDEDIHALTSARPRGIRHVEARVWGYLFVEALGANIVVVGANVPAHLLAESAPQRVQEHPQAILGAGLSDALGVRAGDRLALPDSSGRTRTFVVAGVMKQSTSLTAHDTLFVSQPDARALLGMADTTFTDVRVDLIRAEEALAASTWIRRTIPSARIIERSSLQRLYALSFGSRSGLFSLLLLPTLLFLLIATWERFSGLSQADRAEIALLKAVGWETSHVLKSIAIEAMVLLGAAFWFAILLSYFFVFVLGAEGLHPAILGWSELYPPLTLPVTMPAGSIFLTAAIVLGPLFFATLIPAWFAATSDPSEVL